MTTADGLAGVGSGPAAARKRAAAPRRRGRAVLRISVSTWRTMEADVIRTLAAVRRVLQAVRAAPE